MGQAHPLRGKYLGPDFPFQSSGQIKPANPVGSVPTAVLIPSGSSITAQGNSVVLLVIVAAVHGWGQGAGRGGTEPLVTGNSSTL